ncbi:MAG: hypothetical protein K2L28_05245, partial [Muribaculaceae bacterium]|nr:hypothetical protein [Muribaculaceae bacterium]
DLTVTYDGAAQDESRDAFYAYRSTFRVTGPMSETITLTRPFSQINIGTSDYAAASAAGLSVENTAVTVKGVYGKLNLATGAVDELTDAEFTVAAIPTDGETFPYEPATYKYMAMNYVLVGPEKATVDVEFTAPGTQYAGATFTAVPVQRNFRTNIFGALLTSPAEFEVIINPDYETPDYDFDASGAVVEMTEEGTVNCIVPALPKGVAAKDLEGKGGVAVDAEGNAFFFDATGKAVNAAMQTATELYFAPNTTITTTSHAMVVPQTGITIHGNGATISGGECDFSIQGSYSGTVDINLSNLNNVKVWGGASGDATLNINLKNCTMNGSGLSDGGKSLIMTRGGNAKAINITVDGCYVQNVQDGIHSTYSGTLTFCNSTFKTTGIPVNVAKKVAGETADIAVSNCIFDNCGIAPTATNIGASTYAAPVRVVDNGGEANTITLLVDGCTFINTQSEWDVLLMDYRDGKTWFAVDCTIKNCTPADLKVRAE